MLNRNYLRTAFVIAFLAGLFIVLRSSSRIEAKVPSNECSQECKKKAGLAGPGNMIMDNLSRQFFSVNSACY